ncbi:MAG: hypothetical protein AAFU61_06990 [Pseudomonadota bacterium]
MLAISAGAWIVMVSTERHRACVRLDNGLALGFEALVDFGRPFLRPKIVPKFENGRPLVTDPLWDLFVTPTSVHGSTLAVRDDVGFRFAWRADLGLVKERDDAAAYALILAEGGPANAGLGEGSLGPRIVFDRLRERRGAALETCATRWATW